MQGPPRRLLQTRRARTTARRQRLHLLLPGDHAHLRPRRLSPATYGRPRRRRQGKDRTLLPPRPRSVPRSASSISPRSKPSTGSSPHWVEQRLQRDRTRRDRHEAHRPLRHRPEPRPLPLPVRTQRRTLLRRGRHGRSKRTTPSASRTAATKRPSTSATRTIQTPLRPTPQRRPARRHRLLQGPTHGRRPTPRRRRQRTRCDERSKP